MKTWIQKAFLVLGLVGLVTGSTVLGQYLTETYLYQGSSLVTTPTTEQNLIQESVPIQTPTPTPTQEVYTSWVLRSDGYYSRGADGEPIVLVNNPSAVNPSWLQLYTFLRYDPTDKQIYSEGSFICGDFAEMLHNNAEKRGWKAAYVSIKLGPSECYPNGVYHALNAFKTTDRGLVYIDSTGLKGETAGPSGRDKGVDLLIGFDYRPYSIFGEESWSLSWASLGVVESKLVMQW